MWLGLKTIVFLFLYIWVRAAFPRYRYDQLMRLGWKVFLPLSLAWVVFVSGVLVGFDLLPCAHPHIPTDYVPSYDPEDWVIIIPPKW